MLELTVCTSDPVTNPVAASVVEVETAIPEVSAPEDKTEELDSWATAEEELMTVVVCSDTAAVVEDPVIVAEKGAVEVAAS